MTNSPAYDWHLLNLRNYANLTPQAARPHAIDGVSLAPFGAGSGMLGLPGDFTPPSRFVRAVAFVNTMVHAKDAADAVNAASVMLNNFDIPKGLVREGSAGGLPPRLHAMVGHRRHEPQGLLLLDDVRSQDALGRSFQAGLHGGKAISSFPLDKVRIEDIQDRSVDLPREPRGWPLTYPRLMSCPRKRASRFHGTLWIPACARMTRQRSTSSPPRGPARSARLHDHRLGESRSPPAPGSVAASPRHLPSRTISRTTSL